MTTSNLVFDKGTFFVFPGGGSAGIPLPIGLTNQLLRVNLTTETGLEWASAGNGDVAGPGSAVAHNFAGFADTSGDLLEDSGYSFEDFATGAGSSTAGHLVSFSGTDGAGLADSGVVAADVVTGPASTADNTIPRYHLTTGKVLQSSNTTMSDADLMTFPAGGGVKYTAGATKGSFTFSSGTTSKILTAQAVTGCAILYTIVSLGTVTEAQAILSTIDTGVGFTPVSADATDTSVVNWHIIG